MRLDTTKLGTLIVFPIFALTACLGGGARPRGTPGGGAKVDPDSCAITGSDVGKKLTAFFHATVELDTQVAELAKTVKKTCIAMGKELGMPAEVLQGEPNEVCKSVADNLREALTVSLEAKASFKVVYTPAVCTVNIDAAARASAECEAEGSATVGVRCQGSCEGTCNGGCSGTCSAKNADGSCAGQCEGNCAGTCSGTCEGSADVQGSAECKASAEVRANVEATCTEPKLDVQYDTKLVVDAKRFDQARAAIRLGLPTLFQVKAKIEGPIKSAFGTWSGTAKDLAGSASDIAGAFSDQALCVSGQIGAAFSAMAQIEVNMSVSVEASASVGGACHAEAGE